MLDGAVDELLLLLQGDLADSLGTAPNLYPLLFDVLRGVLPCGHLLALAVDDRDEVIGCPAHPGVPGLVVCLHAA